jgi:glutamyl-tRNA synthetase
MKLLSNAPKLLAPILERPTEWDWSPLKMPDKARNSVVILAGVKLAETPEWSATAIEECLRKVAEELDLKLKAVAAVIYIAVLGNPVAPPLFGSLEFLGRKETLRCLWECCAEENLE